MELLNNANQINQRMSEEDNSSEFPIEYLKALVWSCDILKYLLPLEQSCRSNDSP